jgi:hypothetical protein
MKSVRLLLLALLTTMLLTACDPESFRTQFFCPFLRQYSQAQQDQALRELEALPRGSMLRTMMGDYLNLRDQVRACRGEK